MVAPKIKPKAMVLTDRDREILGALYHLRILKTNQIHRLFFSEARANIAARRLKLLTDNGYLKCDNFTTWGDRQENRYSLSRKSIEIAAVEALDAHAFNIHGDRAYYTERGNYVDPTQQIHQLAINEVFVRLYENHCFSCSDVMPVFTVLKSQWYETRRAISIVKGVSVKPDAKFIIGDTVYWLEMDRATEGIAQISSKFKRYADLYFHDEQFRNKKHTILFFCENGEKLTNKYFRLRIQNICKKAIERLDIYLDEQFFDVYVDESGALSKFMLDVLIPQAKKEKLPPIRQFANELKEWGRTRGYKCAVIKEPSNNPIQQKFKYKPEAWFQYQTSTKAYLYILADIQGMPMSKIDHLSQVFRYCHEFLYEIKIPLRALVIADNEQD